MYVRVPHVYLVPLEVRRGRQVPGTGVTDGVSHHLGTGKESGPLQEQHSFNCCAMVPPLGWFI